MLTVRIIIDSDAQQRADGEKSSKFPEIKEDGKSLSRQCQKCDGENTINIVGVLYLMLGFAFSPFPTAQTGT